MSRWWSWIVMAGVLVVTLFVGATEERAPRTENERVVAIAAEVRCPTCQSLSAAESDAAAAQAIRDEIRTRLRSGQGEDQILAFLASRYGDDILLRPASRGIAGLVWILPVSGAVLALGALAMALRRWRTAPAGTHPSEDDRARVAEALRQ